MDTSSTIVAPATPNAPGQRAVLRMSGASAFDAIDTLLDQPIERRRGVTSSRLVLPFGVLPTLAICLPGPASYTGEDTVELLLPGSPTLIDALVRALLALPDVRHAEAGEFSARAYLNGRLTLQQAEGVASTIAAATQAQLDASHRLLAGESGRRYARIVDELASALALVEAAADFAEEEHVVPINAGDLRTRLLEMHDHLVAEMLGLRGKESPAARPMVALIGPPNAGKTSLFNALLGRTRAVATPVEHATRDAIVEPLRLHHPELGDLTCDLADLPGLPDLLGQAHRPLNDAERAEVQAVIDESLERTDVAVLCDPAATFDWPHDATRVLRVQTKADALPTHAEGVLAVSVRSGLNLDALRLALAETIDSATRDSTAGLLPRHHDLAERARTALTRALDAIAHDPPAGPPIEGELVAAEMRLALDALGELGGQVHPDEVLGRIFASFCVGK